MCSTGDAGEFRIRCDDHGPVAAVVIRFLSMRDARKKQSTTAAVPQRVTGQCTECIEKRRKQDRDQVVQVVVGLRQSDLGDGLLRAGVERPEYTVPDR